MTFVNTGSYVPRYLNISFFGHPVGYLHFVCAAVLLIVTVMFPVNVRLYSLRCGMAVQKGTRFAKGTVREGVCLFWVMNLADSFPGIGGLPILAVVILFQWLKFLCMSGVMFAISFISRKLRSLSRTMVVALCIFVGPLLIIYVVK